MAGDGVCRDIANHRSRMSRYGVSARTPWVGPVLTPLCEHPVCANGYGGSSMKNDVEDIPMIYLVYVLLAIAVIVGIAAIVIVRLIPA